MDKLTRRDPNQIVKNEHDEHNNAKRVVLVGGEKLEMKVDSNKIAEAMSNAVKESIKNFEITKTAVDMDPEPETIIEYKTIEIPTIVPEIKVVEIEKPVIVTKMVEIEKPVIVKETEIKEIIQNVIVKETIYRLHPSIMILLTLMGLTIIGGILYFKGVI